MCALGGIRTPGLLIRSRQTQRCVAATHGFGGAQWCSVVLRDGQSWTRSPSRPAGGHEWTRACSSSSHRSARAARTRSPWARAPRASRRRRARWSSSIMCPSLPQRSRIRPAGCGKRRRAPARRRGLACQRRDSQPHQRRRNAHGGNRSHADGSGGTNQTVRAPTAGTRSVTATRSNTSRPTATGGQQPAAPSSGCQHHLGGSGSSSMGQRCQRPRGVRSLPGRLRRARVRPSR